MLGAPVGASADIVMGPMCYGAGPSRKARLLGLGRGDPGLLAQLRLAMEEDQLRNTFEGVSDLYVERGEMWLQSEDIAGSDFSVDVGHLDFEDERRWWWDEELDALRVRYEAESWEVALAVAYELGRVRSDADDVEPATRAGATVGRTVRDLGRAAGSFATGLRLFDVAPGKLHAPPHCHSAEEEIFVVLEGDGTLELWPRERTDGPEEHPVRRGSVVARPAGTRLAHAFRAGAEGLSFLAYGTRDPRDVAYYPRSGKVSLRGVGVIGRLDVLDYWDGED